MLWGFYNGVLLAVHRAYDHALAGRRWAERLRSSAAFTVERQQGRYFSCSPDS